MRIFRFLLLIFILFFNTGCSNFTKNKNIEIYKIPPLSKITFVGTVVFQYTTNLSFQEDGVITYIPFTKGDYVKKGQIVAKIDDTLYQIRKKEELAALTELKIKHQQSKSYFNRMDILHKAGGVSDNDWEEAGFDTSLKTESIVLQKEKINYINKQLSYTVLLSPFDGYIYSKNSEIGEYITASKPVLTIVSSSKTQVEILVSSNYINKLNINDDVILKRNNKTYHGKISHISQSSSKAGGYLIKILLDKFYFELKEGMNMETEIPKLSQNSVYIPTKALFDNNKVYKIENIQNNTGTVKVKKLQLGQTKNNATEVLRGLKENDFIILEGFNNAKENSKIKL